jgi:hypothetical protein
MPKNRELGMDRKITRRDFTEGASIAVAGSLLPGTGLAAPRHEGFIRMVTLGYVFRPCNDGCRPVVS